MFYKFSLSFDIRILFLNVKRWVLICTVLLATACGGDDMSDLKQHIEEVKIKAKKIAENAPPLTIDLKLKDKIVDYNVTGKKRDPFISWVRAPRRVLRQTGGPRPDKGRTHEALEDYPMDSLRLTGTFKSGGEEIALIKSPNGVIHRIKVGNYMGSNYGKVTKITKTSIKLRELIPNGLGGYTRRTTTLSMKK